MRGVEGEIVIWEGYEEGNSLSFEVVILFNLLFVVIFFECFSNNLWFFDEDLKKGWLFYVFRSFYIYKFFCICLVRLVEREYDDLSLKFWEVEKEVNML